MGIAAFLSAAASNKSSATTVISHSHLFAGTALHWWLEDHHHAVFSCSVAGYNIKRKSSLTFFFTWRSVKSARICFSSSSWVIAFSPNSCWSDPCSSARNAKVYEKSRNDWKAWELKVGQCEHVCFSEVVINALTRRREKYSMYMILRWASNNKMYCRMTPTSWGGTPMVMVLKSTFW